MGLFRMVSSFGSTFHAFSNISRAGTDPAVLTGKPMTLSQIKSDPSVIQQKRLKVLKRINAELNNLEALAGVAKLQSIPTHLEIDFSSKCNLRCTMCHQSKLKMGSFQLQHADIDALINALPYVETVMIAGLGEPLLYRGLETFLPFLSRYGCHAHLFTNGQLIDKRLDALVHVQRISVSIDGASKAVFEELRRGASFERVINNVRLLRARAVKSTIVTSTVISNRNLHEIADIVALAVELGLNEVHLSPVDHTPALMLTPELYPAFEAQLVKARALASRAKLELHNNITAAHFRHNRNATIASSDLAKAATLNELPVLFPGAQVEGQYSELLDSTDLEAQTEGSMDISSQFIHGLDAQAEVAEIEQRISQQSAHLNALRKRIKQERQKLQTPYCSAPWKYGFARSNGHARLCPYADINVGAVRDKLSGNYNSVLLEQVRGSLAQGQPVLFVCQNCSDDHRQFRAVSLEHARRAFARSSLTNQLILWLRQAKQWASGDKAAKPPWPT